MGGTNAFAEQKRQAPNPRSAMEFTIKSGSPEKQRSACVVVGVFDNRKLSLSAELIDRASNGYISEIIRRGDMEGKLGSTLLLHNVRGTLADRVLLIGLGKERDFRDKEFRTAARAAVTLLNETGSYEAVIYLTEEKVKRREVAWRVEHAVIVAMDSVYRFEQMKSEPAEVRRPLRKLTLSVPQRSDLSDGEAATARGLAIAHGMDFARDLGNLPGNVCTPTYLAERALELAREFPDVKVRVLERKELEDLGMGSFLSVTNGSDQPPRFIILEYEQAVRKQRPFVLVGKGITFDSGGISIKPATDMDQMKYDMCGAASVLGVFRTIAELRSKLNVVGLIPACENLPSGRATKPGDDAYDRAWQLPLWDDYQDGLNSNFADFANVAGRAGGSITAACFLSRFARKYDWAHLDIAGIAWKEGKEKGATGRPVPLLATWVLSQEGAA